MAKIKTKAAGVPVPQSRDEAADALMVIGGLNRAAARVEAEMNDEIAAIKKDAESKAQPMREKAAGLTEGLKIWAEANRDQLTQSGKTKTADLGTGKISWRALPKSVRITKVEQVIEAVKKLGFTAFLRVKTEINKDAMLADPDKAKLIAGVNISSAGEEFIVEPFETSLSDGVTPRNEIRQQVAA